jgi:uncharacterized delta-60 repeat protein
MLFPSWLRSRKPRPQRCCQSRPPAVEPLEDRCVPSFGSGGFVTTSITQGGVAGPGLVLSNGNLLVGGATSNGHDEDFALARYTPGGALDPTFGTSGKVATNIQGDDLMHGIAVQSDGKIVAVGQSSFRYSNGYLSTEFAVVRYNANGSLDTTFGKAGKQGGIVLTDFGTSHNPVPSGAGGVAIQPDGKIVVVGSGGPAETYIAIVRYNANGSLDTTFGNGGKIIDTTGNNAGLGTIKLMADGSFLATGRLYGGFLVARYLSNGAPDPSFATNGKFTAPSDIGFGAGDAALTPDGHIVAAGGDLLYRLDSGGNPDPTFGNNGQVSLTSFPALYNSYGGPVIHDMALQSDGRAVLVGEWDGYPHSVLAEQLLRFNTDGSLDSTFGSGGSVHTSIGYSNFANSVSIQSDGKIVTYGAATFGTPPAPQETDFAVVRYNTDGTLDANPLVAASAPPASVTQALTAGQLRPLVAEAERRWEAAGVSAARLSAVRVSIAALPPSYLGMESGTRIWVSPNAAGWGWFVDPTPRGDTEFTTAGDQGEQNRMDLLTVLMHEMGHALGLDHDGGGVMQEALTPGTRRLPTADEVGRLPVARPVPRPADSDVLFALLSDPPVRHKGRGV